MLNRIFYIYLIIINFAAFLLMAIDKWKAKKHAWRIRERTLFLSALIGGCPGALLGMYTFRHKTKHLRFRIGMPVILLLQLLLLYYSYTHTVM